MRKTKWTKASITQMVEAEAYKTRSEFAKANPYAANLARKMGLMDNLFGKTTKGRKSAAPIKVSKKPPTPRKVKAKESELVSGTLHFSRMSPTGLQKVTELITKLQH